MGSDLSMSPPVATQYVLASVEADCSDSWALYRYQPDRIYSHASSFWELERSGPFMTVADALAIPPNVRRIDPDHAGCLSDFSPTGGGWRKSITHHEMESVLRGMPILVGRYNLPGPEDLALILEEHIASDTRRNPSDLARHITLLLQSYQA